MRHNNNADTAMPLGRFLATLGVVLVLGMAGVIILPMAPSAGVLFLGLAVLVAIALLRSDPDPDPLNPELRRRPGVFFLDMLHGELEFRTVVGGERFGFTPGRPERSLTRR